MSEVLFFLNNVLSLRAYVCFIALLIGIVGAAQEQHGAGGVEDRSDDILRLNAIVQLLVDTDEIDKVFEGRSVHMFEYNAMQRGVRKLAAMRPDASDIIALDDRFADGITGNEWVDFLFVFGLEGADSANIKTTNDNIEEVVAYGFSFRGIPMDPEQLSVIDIQRMRLAREHANKLYREGEYERAYPILLSLAKRGFRDAQSRLAYILFNGAGEVQKSNLRALGWLGAASASPSEPRFKVLFKKYMRQVPEHALPTVQRIVAGYRDEYSHSEHWSCSIEHPYAVHHGSSIVKRVHCRYRLEAIAWACRAGGGGRCWADKVNEDPGHDSVDFDDQFSLEERLRSMREAQCLDQPDRIECT